jgi:F-type H+-transporting ATPase subunit epsilon
MASAIHCKVIAPAGVLFEGEAASIRGPGYEGGFGILPRHAPYLVQLAAGRLSLRGEDGTECFGLDLESGFLMVARDQCTVLVEAQDAEAAASST